ncbi:PqqD family protein [Spirosoma areae]
MKLKKSVAISENGFVFNASRGDSFSTNPAGTQILDWLRDGKTDKDMMGLLLEKYEIDEATCEKDLYDFINMLKQQNLVEA